DRCADDVDRDPPSARHPRLAAGARYAAAVRDGDDLRTCRRAPRERRPGEGSEHPAQPLARRDPAAPPPAPEDHTRRESFALSPCSPLFAAPFTEGWLSGLKQRS